MGGDWVHAKSFWNEVERRAANIRIDISCVLVLALPSDKSLVPLPLFCHLMKQISPQDLLAAAEEEVEPAEVPAAAAPLPAFPAGTFRPGRVVWAKVEGHEWWPAKVVRRRAVPRDVAEPPGGKAFVRLFTPVIFFTAQGIPGETKSFKDRLDAALAASAHSGEKPILDSMLRRSSVIFQIST